MSDFDFELFLLNNTNVLLDGIFAFMTERQIRVTLAMVNMTSKALYHVSHDYELVKKIEPINRRLWAEDLIYSGFNDLLRIMHTDLIDLEFGKLVDIRLYEPLKIIYERTELGYYPLAIVSAELGKPDCFKIMNEALYTRQECLKAAARGGQLECVEFIVGTFNNKKQDSWDTAARIALYASRFDVLKFLLDKGCRVSEIFLPKDYVERRNFMASFECIKLCLDRGAVWHHVIVDATIESKNPDVDRICTYALDNNLALGTRIWEYATRRGDTHLLRTLKHKNVRVRDVEYIISKVSYEHSDAFAFVLETFRDRPFMFIQKARSEMNLQLFATVLDSFNVKQCQTPLPYEFVMHLKNNGIKYTLDYEYALKSGDLRLIELCYEELGPPKYNPIDEAIKSGDKELVTYLRKKGFPWTEHSCQIAADYGNVKLLKYAHKDGAPWNERTCINAAKNGHLACLTYAHKNGCPWNGEVYEVALNNCQVECFEYASAHLCPPTKRKAYHPIPVSIKMLIKEDRMEIDK